LSKINSIRKKALELVRKQDWASAVKEYKRLAELDQSNPNVFNELGDIYLKTGNKTEAYEAFLRAIDSYTHVSLHNNAVAVCKKVLRLLPTRIEVLTKLGYIRLKQGLAREAESYYHSYLDKVAGEQSVDRGEFVRISGEIAEAMPQSAGLLERVVQALEQLGADDAGGRVHLKLLKAHLDAGSAAAAGKLQAKLNQMGFVEEAAAVRASAPQDGKVITEENIWTEAHTAGERMSGHASASAKEEAPDPPAGSPPAKPPAAESVPGYGDVDVPGAPPEPEATADPADEEPSAEPAPSPPPPIVEEPKPAAEPEPPAHKPASRANTEPVHVSAIIEEMGEDGTEDSEADYRSHYDLGMAYLEMELFADAVREFQAASSSAQFRVRSLEMIGLCFLRQNQAGLAIKQLSKGLSMVGENDREALGIKYNLGLAYEMAGDLEKARSQFEDVYVIDVTFRDVSEKLAKCTS